MVVQCDCAVRLYRAGLSVYGGVVVLLVLASSGFYPIKQSTTRSYSSYQMDKTNPNPQKPTNVADEESKKLM